MNQFEILFIGATIPIIVLLALKALAFIKEVISSYREHKLMMDNLEDFRKKGGVHDWVEVSIGGKKQYACSKTGYCPLLNGFVSPAYVRNIKTNATLEKDMLAFVESKKAEIGMKYGISVENLTVLMDEVYSIKKDFALKRMNTFLEDLKKERKDDV
jgi:hypothetical protein